MNQFKHFLILSLFLILQACDQYEEIQELNVENPQNKIGKTALRDDEQAAFLINQLQNVTSSGRFSGASETAFDSAIFHLDVESGFKNYAFLLSGDNVEQMSNLVFIQTDTAFIGYETIYEPTTEHLANLQAGNSIMLNFTGTMSYRSIQTGEVFLEVQYENGIPVPPETASNGRLPLSDGCYPDEAGRIECYTVYVTTDNDGSYTSSTTGINYNNHTFDEPDSPHTDVYNSCMVIDADFSSCYHTFFNTNGMTSYPQYYAGSSQGTLASTSLGPVYEPIDLFSFLGNRWEEDNIVDNNLKPCMQTIMTDLKNLTQGVGQIVTKFAGNVPGYNWEASDNTLNGQTAVTSTKYNTTTGTVTSEFDSQSWPNATELSWARTILHESIHANVVAVYYTTLSTTQRAQLLGPNWINALANGGHDFIANNYISLLADALEEYGHNKGYSLGRQFYVDMAWAGLQGTSKFNNLPAIDKSRILNTIAIELTGQDLNGNVKTQKGTNAGC